MRTLIFLLLSLFITACVKNEGEIAGIKVGSKLEDVKEIESYEVIESYFNDGETCKILSVYFKDDLDENGRRNRVILVVIDNKVHGITEEFNLHGKGSVSLLDVESRQKEVNRIYGDPIDSRSERVSSDIEIQVFDYKPTKDISRIKFTHEYYDNGLGYAFSLHDKTVIEIENMKEVESCN